MYLKAQNREVQGHFRSEEGTSGFTIFKKFFNLNLCSRNVQKLKSVSLKSTSGLTSGVRPNFRLLGKNIKSWVFP